MDHPFHHGENESWISEQARPDDDDDIIAMYNTTI